MLELIPFDEDNIIGFRLDGRIGDEEFKELVRIIEDKLERHDRLRIYAEIDDIGGMSIDTFLESMSLKFRHFRDFEMEAVVSDKQWLESWSKVVDAIIPSFEVKYFTKENAEEAKDWLRGARGGH